MLNDYWKDRVSEELKIEMEKHEMVCGIDEVGRGPIAGPVLACAIIMPRDQFIGGVKDSKKLTAKKRENLYKEILDSCLALGIGMVDEKIIDQINIRQATLLAMQKAYYGLKDKEGNPVKADLVMVDHEKPEIGCMEIALDKGDDRVYQIAAASIVAKVTRDRIMVEFGEKYPEYAFKSHKGYGTKKHYDAIKMYGLLPIHRRSFIHGDFLFEHKDYELEEVERKAFYDELKRKRGLG